MTFRPNWWIIGAIFEEICIYVEENEGFGQPLIPFILLIGELQMGPYMVTYWCVSECCSLIGSHRLYVYRNVTREHHYIAFDEYYNEPIGRSFGNCDIYNTTITWLRKHDHMARYFPICLVFGAKFQYFDNGE